MNGNDQTEYNRLVDAGRVHGAYLTTERYEHGATLPGSERQPRFSDRSRPCRLGFTLVELLVVIAIIGILASMLLPVLSQGMRKTRLTQCVNNLKQIGAGIAMYVHDNNDRFPGEYGYDWWPIIGGRDARADCKHVPRASQRPLFPYVPIAQSFHCPEDHGCSLVVDRDGDTLIDLKPTAWEVAGCSYTYNDMGLHTRQPPDGYLAGNKVNWVPDPARFILMYEWPAQPRRFEVRGGGEMSTYWNWHGAWGTYEYFSEPYEPPLSRDPFKFISPILFVEGHVKVHDFTRTVHEDGPYWCEPKRDWMWYKPAPDATNQFGSK